jgi:hypothetical protein
VAVKKTAKKAAPKKVAKKSVTKKAVAKKSTAKKAAPKKVAKKAVAKKTTAKKVAKKSAAKKTAVKKVAKKATAKKTTAKKVAKKAPARKVAASSVVVPPVPTTGSRDRVNVSTTPVAPVKPAVTPAKPSAAPRQGSSKSVLVAVLLGVAILVGIVASQQSKTSTKANEDPTPAASASATPAASESASPAASTDTTNAATTGEAPSRFIGNWKDASTKAVLVLSWKAPAGDVKGYKVEIAPNGGAWKEISQVPATQLSFDLNKTSDSAYTSFRVSAIYADGSLGVAKAFGFAGQYE